MNTGQEPATDGAARHDEETMVSKVVMGAAAVALSATTGVAYALGEGVSAVRRALAARRS